MTNGADIKSHPAHLGLGASTEVDPLFITAGVGTPHRPR